MQDPKEAPKALDPATDNTADPQPATESDHGDTMPSAEELLQTAELKAEEHHDAWLRAKAEVENTRRRASDEAEKARKFAIEKFAGELLAVRDSLEAAMTSETTDVATLREGVDVTLKQLTAAFEKFQLVECNPLNERFDPHQHQAISTVEDDGEPNRVVTVLQKGYLLAERTLRPALVIVSKAKGA